MEITGHSGPHGPSSGWGFSVVWRSLPGHYRDLTLIPSEVGFPPTISVAQEP